MKTGYEISPKLGIILGNIGRSDDSLKFGELLRDLRSRRIERCEAEAGEDWGKPKRIRANAITYSQALLFRAIHLLEGSLRSLEDENPCSLALSVRANFETTAALGFLHRRLQSMKKGNLTADQVDKDLWTLLMGAKHNSTPSAPDPKNVLTMLKHADKSVSVEVLEGGVTEHSMLTESYEYLCEYCHPNFLSNQLALDLDRERKAFVFMHDKPVRRKDLSMIGYALLSGPAFVKLFDATLELVTLPTNRDSDS